ncbi:glycoside hydrolase family 3 C-terminal domain-containing protein [candidate division KSB1 bacterium]|nr:glycoside hydrolase family 3 C-terminal domain-containing protein [candidate division KSB1 bacterium]
MKNITLLMLVFLSIICNFLSAQSDRSIYKNPDQPIEERVKDLLSRMTLEEKFWQLFMIPGDLSDGKEKYQHGIFGLQVATTGNSGKVSEQLLTYNSSGTAKFVAGKINAIQRYFIEETRLGIPIIPFDEALHGLVRDGATAFPQAIGLAATWNTELMHQVTAAIAKETRTRGIRQILSPVVNIARDVRWGRVEETYGEDPFLTSQMGLAFVAEFEKMGIITTPKHFAANVGDGGRDSYPIHFNERLLDEIYFPAYKVCIQQGGTQSIMAAYNSLDGRPCSANDWLLNKKLKAEWGFNGFVIADAGAVPGMADLHLVAPDYAATTKQAFQNGLDVIFQTDYNHYSLFYEAFEKGLLVEKQIDDAVSRVLRAKFKIGLFENPYIEPEEAEKWNGHPNHRKLARQAARESIVLLKNENQILPLKETIRSIAVIGQDAVEARLGGYSGPGINKVSILDGIKNRINKSQKVYFIEGCGRKSTEYIPVSSNNLSCLVKGKTEKGLWGEYFNNIRLEGQPALSRIDNAIQFQWTLFSPQHQVINYDWYSVRWTGKLKAPVTGTFKIGIEGNDGYRLYLNNKLLIDNWKKQTYQTILTDFSFIEDQAYDIKIEFFESVGNAKIKLVWNYGIGDSDKKAIAEAVKTAQKCDLAIIVAGIEEGEFQDRACLGLPGHQEKLIQKVAETGVLTIVVLVGGSAITMNSWLNKVDAILDVWYPGEEGGNAVADVLFGDYNPAGRLPITFPIHESQLPLYYNHKPTGRGDDYNNLTGQPLFPFGFGLSYTTFEYGDLTIEKKVFATNENTKVSFNLKNTGTIAGDEVVQLYIKDLLASVTRPVMELKGFKRVHLAAGETKKVEFEITPQLLSMPDKDLTWIVEPGDFKIMIGGSSKDIRLREIITVE